MNLLHGHFLAHNVPSCRPHLGIPVNWNLSVPCYERDLLCRLFYILSCPQLKSFLSNMYYFNECMTLSCTPNTEYTFCSLYFAFVPKATSLSFHSLSLSLLCITGLLSQSSDDLSCPNGLPKHRLQYNLLLLALKHHQLLWVHSVHNPSWQCYCAPVCSGCHRERGAVWGTGGCASTLRSDDHHTLPTARTACESAIGTHWHDYALLIWESSKEAWSEAQPNGFAPGNTMTNLYRGCQATSNAALGWRRFESNTNNNF